MKLSAALIVRNESRTLARCLTSIARAVDETVVVDTGSTDETKAIALAHGARVFDFPWCDDFSAARQFAFDQATGDWVFWIDADDVVLGAENLKPTLEQASPQTYGFYWRYVLGRDAGNTPTLQYWRERCVRNDRAARWSGRVHEVLTVPTPGGLVRSDAVVVEHHPLPAHEKDPTRNLRILEAECAVRTPEPRSLFYLGREYADHNLRRRAIDTLRRYVPVSTWSDERYVAQVLIARLLRQEQEHDQAIEAAWEAMKTRPRWPDAYFDLACTYYFMQEWEHVAHWCEVGQRLPVPDTLMFVNPRTYTFDWIIYYTNALHRLGRQEEALSWSLRALEIEPEDAWHRQNADYFRSIVG